jgi:hypothetical protein
MTDRKKPGVAFWATVAVVLALVAYPLSFGPVCWTASRVTFGATRLPVVYRPMTLAMSSSDAIHDTLQWYAKVGAVSDWRWQSIRPVGKAEVWTWTPLHATHYSTYRRLR